MSGNINILDPERPKRVLMVVANPAVSPTTGWPVGFWWAELTHPYWTFREAGWEVEVRSPDGGDLEADGFSDPEHESGYSADDILSLGFKTSPSTRDLVKGTTSTAGVDVSAYDAVFFVGGQSPMVTFVDNPAVHGLIARFYEAGKVTCLVCHATCALLGTTLSTGELLVSGKTWTGFANREEDIADQAVGRTLQPFRIEDRARALEGTNFVVDQAFRPFAVRDGRLVTGQQQASGAAAAALVIEAAGR
ncbi:MAG: type 1 glutamine amidotransferase domain-containing protein [Sandaracinaceae bacterium]